MIPSLHGQIELIYLPGLIQIEQTLQHLDELIKNSSYTIWMIKGRTRKGKKSKEE